MIIEGILTTQNSDGSVRIAAMGAVIDDAAGQPLRRLILRPFPTTRTLANLKRTGQAVFHVTDDVELLARAALGRIEQQPPMVAAESVAGFILGDACRWYALRVCRMDESGRRALVEAEVVDHGRIREFAGLNRAKHAVVEASILATRLHLLPAQEVREAMARLALLVEKTGGPGERAAWQFLVDYVRRSTEPSS